MKVNSQSRFIFATLFVLSTTLSAIGCADDRGKTAPIPTAEISPVAVMGNPADMIGGSDFVNDRVVQRGDAATIAGWTLLNGATPKEIVVTLNGSSVGVTSSFVVRTDVNDHFQQEYPPSGWQISVPTTDVQPGSYQLGISARGDDGRLVSVPTEQPLVLTVTP